MNLPKGENLPSNLGSIFRTMKLADYKIPLVWHAFHPSDNYVREIDAKRFCRFFLKLAHFTPWDQLFFNPSFDDPMFILNLSQFIFIFQIFSGRCSLQHWENKFLQELSLECYHKIIQNLPSKALIKRRTKVKLTKEHVCLQNEKLSMQVSFSFELVAFHQVISRISEFNCRIP